VATQDCVSSRCHWWHGWRELARASIKFHPNVFQNEFTAGGII
jgi:hypothetical protein